MSPFCPLEALRFRVLVRAYSGNFFMLTTVLAKGSNIFNHFYLCNMKEIGEEENKRNFRNSKFDESGRVVPPPHFTPT
jgi:hypothetical protein